MPHQEMAACRITNEASVRNLFRCVASALEGSKQVVLGADHKGWSLDLFQVITWNRRGNRGVVSQTFFTLTDWFDVSEHCENSCLLLRCCVPEICGRSRPNGLHHGVARKLRSCPVGEVRFQSRVHQKLCKR